MVASAAAWLVAAGLFGFVAATDGDVLLGWAAIITALAGVIAAVGTSVANLRRTGQVQQTAAEVAAAVGPPNGRNLQQVLRQVENNQASIKATQDEIRTFEKYQHDRNHTVLAGIAEIKLTSDVLVVLAERLLEKLGKEK